MDLTTCGEDEAVGEKARDLVRKRTGDYRAPETGRMHHIGAAPDEVPVHTDEGVRSTRSTGWQLADRTPAQLEQLRERAAADMAAAAADLDFERAAGLRDELVAVEGEMARRSS